MCVCVCVCVDERAEGGTSGSQQDFELPGLTDFYCRHSSSLSHAIIFVVASLCSCPCLSVCLLVCRSVGRSPFPYFSLVKLSSELYEIRYYILLLRSAVSVCLCVCVCVCVCVRA